MGFKNEDECLSNWSTTIWFHGVVAQHIFIEMRTLSVVVVSSFHLGGIDDPNYAVNK